MPTLYATGENQRQSKPSLTQLLLYNMSSVLASVAVGYDVRMSNVSPVHPSLQPKLIASDDDDTETDTTSHVQSEFVVPQRTTFPHNTYHGPTKHTR